MSARSEVYPAPTPIVARTMLRRFELDVRGRQNAALLGLLVALQFAGVVFTPISMIDPESLLGLAAIAAMGSCLAPPTLLALWAVFGPGRVAVRLPLTMWLAAALYVTILFAVIQDTGDENDAAFIYLSCWLLAFVYLLVPLWLLRALRRWRFVPKGVSSEAASKGATVEHGQTPGNQFTVRGLLGWTLAAAIPLAALRALMANTSFDGGELLEFLPAGALAGLLVAAAGLPIVPLAWILLAAGRRLVLRLVLSVLLLAGLSGGVWLFIYFAGGPELPELIPVLAGTIANGVVSLSVVGACGYRLNRQPKSSAGGIESADIPGVAVRPPLSRVRFALALAPLAMVGVAILCAVPSQLRQWRQAAIVVEWARSGVQVNFDGAGKLLNVHGVNAALMSDELLRRVAALTDLEFLDLADTKIGDRQLALLAPLNNLQSLDLGNCDITDAGLEQVVQFKNLQILGLTNTAVTDAGLSRLKALPKLVSLDLQVTDITDDGLATLAAMRLRRLDVSLTAVSGAAAKRFEAACPNVSIQYGASDALLGQRLVNRNPVVVTSVAGVVSHAIAIEPRPLKRLHAHGAYNLGGVVLSVSDAGLKLLAEHTELEELDLHDSLVTDQGLRELVKLTALRKLDLRGTHVTEQGVARLAPSLPECEILR